MTDGKPREFWIAKTRPPGGIVKDPKNGCWVTPIAFKQEQLLIKNGALAKGATRVIEKSAFDSLLKQAEAMAYEIDAAKRGLAAKGLANACLDDALLGWHAWRKENL